MRRLPPITASRVWQLARAVAVAAAAACNALPAMAEGDSIGGAIGGGSAAPPGGGTGGSTGGSIGGKIAPAPAPSTPSPERPAHSASPERLERPARSTSTDRRKPSRRNEQEIRRAARPEPERGGDAGSVSRFDGLWTVSTSSASCSASSTSSQRISRGHIVGLARGGSASGSVTASGSVHFVGRYGSTTTVGSGRLSGNSGGGSFRRSDGCTGTWNTSR